MYHSWKSVSFEPRANLKKGRRNCFFNLKDHIIQAFGSFQLYFINFKNIEQID